MFRISAFILFVMLIIVVLYLFVAYFYSVPMARTIRRYINGIFHKHKKYDESKKDDDS